MCLCDLQVRDHVCDLHLLAAQPWGDLLWTVITGQRWVLVASSTFELLSHTATDWHSQPHRLLRGGVGTGASESLRTLLV